MRVPGRLVLSAMLLSMVAGLGWAGAAKAQDAPPANGVTQVPTTPEKPDPLKRRLSDKEKMKQQKDLTHELHGFYAKWLDQDGVWIITDTERQAFKNLNNDEERDAFIEDFWRRRNPNPDSPDDEFKEEHYARIAY